MSEPLTRLFCLHHADESYRTDPNADCRYSPPDSRIGWKIEDLLRLDGPGETPSATNRVDSGSLKAGGRVKGSAQRPLQLPGQYLQFSPPDTNWPHDLFLLVPEPALNDQPFAFKLTRYRYT